MAYIKHKEKKWCVLFFNDWIRTAFVGGLVYAAEKQVDQSIYEIGKFHIDTFSSYLSDSEFSLGKMLFGANGTDFLKMMTNMFFSLSKLIWQGLDFVIEKLYEGAAMNELIHQFFTFRILFIQKYTILLVRGLSSCMCYIYLLFVYLEGNITQKWCLFDFSSLSFFNGLVWLW